MLQRFYTDTLQSKFIKYILSQIHLPTIPFTANLSHVIVGCYYIHNNYIIKINQNAVNSETVATLHNAIPVSELSPTMYVKYEPYIFGKQYPGFTTKFISSSNSYDSLTHYYLGLYLRAVKGYYGIDLMPFYNCYTDEISTVGFEYAFVRDVTLHGADNSTIKVITVPENEYLQKPMIKSYPYSIQWYTSPSRTASTQFNFNQLPDKCPNIYMEEDATATDIASRTNYGTTFLADTSMYNLQGTATKKQLGVKYNTNRKGYKYVSVPIKFCETYTIAIDCPTAVEFLPCFIDESGLIKDESCQLFNNAIMPTKDTSVVSNYFHTSMQFSDPVYFQAPALTNVKSSLFSYEKYLRLLIKLPETCQSSIVVIQGKHRNLKPQQDVFFSTSLTDIEKSTEFDGDFVKYLNENMLTKLSLLNINDHCNYAFSSRLVEYLSNNVITSTEKLPKNIEIVQEGLNMGLGTVNGIWDTDIRLQTFEKVSYFLNLLGRKNINDMNGFIDKDVEAIITSKKFKNL